MQITFVLELSGSADELYRNAELSNKSSHQVWKHTVLCASNANIIKAGDAKVICQFDVMPVENTDIIIINGERYNIVASGDTSPDNITKIIYTLQVRRANG